MRHFGFRQAAPDSRDRMFRIGRITPLPNVVDLRPDCPTAFDQGNLSSCVACAVVGCVGYQDGLTTGPDMSQLFTYYNARLIDGDPGSDNGTYVKSAIQAVKVAGLAPDHDWPYDEAKVCVEPSEKAYDEAKQYPIESYEKLTYGYDMRVCLARGVPFTGGIRVYESFMDVTSDLVPEIGANESEVGLHAVMFCGYDIDRNLFLIRNSWGPTWGKDGFAWLPACYWRGTMDMWAITKLGYEPEENA
jgi:C1A family cysteine protease